MEEDIKILEEKVIALERHIKIYEESDCRTAVYEELVKEKQATSNVLSRLKQLEEENTEWRGKYLIELAKVSDLEKELLGEE